MGAPPFWRFEPASVKPNKAKKCAKKARPLSFTAYNFRNIDLREPVSVAQLIG